jgi:hypothetical protein
VLALILISLGSSPDFPPLTDAELTKELGDRLALIQAATQVEVFRLTSKFDSDPHSPLRGTDRWEKSGAPITLSAALAARAQKQVSAAATYSHSMSRCEFVPGVMFRFSSGDQHADVLFCFHCGDAAVQRPESEWPKEVWGYAELFDYTRARLGFVPGFDAMLKLVRDIYPKDPAFKNVERPFGKTSRARE